MAFQEHPRRIDLGLSNSALNITSGSATHYSLNSNTLSGYAGTLLRRIINRFCSLGYASNPDVANNNYFDAVP